jgi:uncharacterized Zn-finger protein
MEGPTGGTGGFHFMDDDFKPKKEAGILPRIAVFLNQEIQRYRTQFGKEIRVYVSALELYCETIRDLLNPSDGHIYLEIQASSNKKVNCPG